MHYVTLAIWVFVAVNWVFELKLEERFLDNVLHFIFRRLGYEYESLKELKAERDRRKILLDKLETAEATGLKTLGDPFKSCHSDVCDGREQHPCHDLDCLVHDLSIKRKFKHES